MNFIGAVIIYILVWWTTFFAVLPRNLKHVSENPEEFAKGVDPGAPQDPQIWEKVKLTSKIAAGIWAVICIVILSGVINFSD